MKLECLKSNEHQKCVAGWKTLDARRDKWSNMWSRRLTVYQNSIRGGTKRLGGFSEQLFLQRARRVRLSEAKVCIVQGVLFWADYTPRVSVGAVPVLTHLTNGSSQLWLLLRQPRVRKYLPFLLYFQWLNWTKHDCINENCRHFTSYQLCDVHMHTCWSWCWYCLSIASIATVSVIWHPRHHLNKPCLLCLLRSNKSVLTVCEDRRFRSFRSFISLYPFRLYPG